MGWGLRWGGGGDRRGPTPVWWVPSAPQTSQDICCVVFAIFNVIWATLFLEEWKRRGAEFAYKWGTLDTPAESIEEPRPQFRVSTFWGGPHHGAERRPSGSCVRGGGLKAPGLVRRIGTIVTPVVVPGGLSWVPPQAALGSHAAVPP